MTDIKLIQNDNIIAVGLNTTKENVFGFVDSFKVLSNVKLLEIEKNTLIQKCTLTWYYYKSENDFMNGKAPTVSEVETIEFKKEFLFSLIQNFYALQSGVVE